MLECIIRDFADKETAALFSTGKTRRLPPDIQRRAILRLTQLDHALLIEDLRFPPANRLALLTGKRQGQWRVRINDQWRLCFRFENGEAFDVEITDYH